jgi:predicted DNA-binding transcriptional regulator AlpA
VPRVGEKGCLHVSMQERLLTVSEVADLLRVKSSWVYDHADDLGAFRLGKYLRFALPRVMERLQRGQS